MKKVLLWTLIVLGAAVVLFIGSAFVAGVQEAKRERADGAAIGRLTHEADLLAKILKEMKAKRGIRLPCWYMGAIGYRLAEARDLKIDQQRAVDATNVPDLVEPLAKIGVNPKHVIAGLAIQVYDSPLSPQATFDTQVEACQR